MSYFDARVEVAWSIGSGVWSGVEGIWGAFHFAKLTGQRLVGISPGGGGGYLTHVWV